MQSGAHGRQRHHAQVFAASTRARAATADFVPGNSARPITRRFLICPAMNSTTTSGAQSILRSSLFFILLPLFSPFLQPALSFLPQCWYRRQHAPALAAAALRKALAQVRAPRNALRALTLKLCVRREESPSATSMRWWCARAPDTFAPAFRATSANSWVSRCVSPFLSLV